MSVSTISFDDLLPSFYSDIGIASLDTSYNQIHNRKLNFEDSL